MTDEQLIKSVEVCADKQAPCDGCIFDGVGADTCDHKLKIAVIDRLRELTEAVEQNKKNVSQETEEIPGELLETTQLEPDRATLYIAISVAEYHCLTKAATLLEVILADKTYNHENVVEAVRNAVADMRQVAEAGGEE